MGMVQVAVVVAVVVGINGHLNKKISTILGCKL